jgi:hypothetical protein
MTRILASPAFRNSKQCQSFLQWVVDHSQNGEGQLLRERMIGVEVFGRAPDYDTAEDPIVRVRATEVRKRLSQYYADSSSNEDVRVEIPCGSYRAEIRSEHPNASAPPRRSVRQYLGWKTAVVAASVLLVAAGILAVGWWTGSTKLDQFWAPVLRNPRPVLIYCGRPVAYFLARNVIERSVHKDGAPPAKASLWEPLTLDPDMTLHGRDLIPVTDKFVGIGSAHSAVLLHGLFAARHKADEIRYANDVSFSDLRNSPTVLIGAFSNSWTLQLTSQLRFVFEGEAQGSSVARIWDRTTNRVWSSPYVAPDGSTSEDYAIVSRLFNSTTGQPLICVAGIGTYATRSAAEFLTDSSIFDAAFAKAPPDWPRKNLQVVIHTYVYKGIPSRPEIVQVYIW